MNDYSFILENMTWSFSRLNYTCLHEFYLNYIECLDGLNSFYGQVGSFCHSILEMYANGELNIFELAPYFEDHYFENVTESAPFNKYKDIGEDTYYKCLEYFENIDMLLDDYDILGVEKEIHFEIAGYPMIGFIDLLLRDKKTNEIIIVDHKLSQIKILKSGKISKSDQQHFLEFKRQLYLYSKAVIEEYGHVDKFKWNMYKMHSWIEIDWNENDYNEAITWALNTIHDLSNVKEWLPKEPCGTNDFYCRNLCGQRDNCIYMNEGSDEEWEDGSWL